MPEPRDLSYTSLSELLIPRDRDSYKGDYGHVLVIGGDSGFGGAVFMAAEAAARTGAGLVSVTTHPDHAMTYLPHRPEIMYRGISHTDQLDLMLGRATVIVLGPGLGMSDWSTRLFSHVMQWQSRQEKPLVVDADALNLLALGICADITGKICKWVLTPNSGEASRLLKCNTSSIQEDRKHSALKLLERFQGAAVLKGAGTLVASTGKDGATRLDRCIHGNPGMATGGMGDVLSGIIGSLLAQGYALGDAARLGVCIHARAGDLAAQNNGERGMLATDLFPWLRQLMNTEPA